MTERVQRILDDALKLTPTEQDELLSELIARLDGESDPDVEEAWAREIERRIERANRGESVATDWEVVRERIQRKLGSS